MAKTERTVVIIVASWEVRIKVWWAAQGYWANWSDGFGRAKPSRGLSMR